MGKYKINYKRFIPFCIIVIAIILVFFIFLVPKILKGIKQNNCDHFFRDGLCVHCGKECEHNYVYGYCLICKKECTHDFKNGKCSVCGEVEDESVNWPKSSTRMSDYPLSRVSNDYLVLVNKSYKLLSDYVPNDLVAVNDYVKGVGDTSQYTNCLRKDAANALNEMIAAAKNEGIILKLRTGYRSYSYQEKLFNSYVKNYGEANANTFSARAGESEHQTGLACDLGGQSEGFALSDYFGDTKEGKWVKENSYKWGFILRYTDGTIDSIGSITKYIYEPWHIRYVGKEAAKIMYENNMLLEEYIEKTNSN